MDRAGNLTGTAFSVPVLGRVFDQLTQRHKAGLEVGLAVLTELTPEEMSHVTGISQRHQGPVNEKAFQDCVAAIRGATQRDNISSNDDLLAFRDKLKERKGTKQ